MCELTGKSVRNNCARNFKKKINFCFAKVVLLLKNLEILKAGSISVVVKFLIKIKIIKNITILVAHINY
jgi:hypothetical protein